MLGALTAGGGVGAGRGLEEEEGNREGRPGLRRARSQHLQGGVEWTVAQVRAQSVWVRVIHPRPPMGVLNLLAVGAPTC